MASRAAADPGAMTPADRHSGRSWARPGAALALLVAVAGACLSVLVGDALRDAQRRSTDQAFERRTALITEAVQDESRRYADAVRMVAASAGALTPLTADGYAQAVAPLRGMRLPGASGIAFVAPAADGEVAAVQARWRARGAGDLVLRPAAGQDRHLFAVFVHGLDGRPPATAGIDVAQAAAPTQALLEAQRSNQITVSDTYRLLSDRALPANRRQLSFILGAAVRSRAAAGPPGSGALRGWVLMGLRGQDFIGAALERASQDTVDVRLLAPAADGSTATVAALRAPGAARRDLSRRVTVRVGQQRWELRIAASSDALGAAGHVPGMATAGGLLLSALLAALVATLATGRARAQARVRVATAELRAAEQDARRQADLVSAVLENISDGVAVADEDGRFLLANPAADALVGVGHDTEVVEGWQRHFGVFKPDGETPFPSHELPLARALAGESSEQVEMVLRNGARPEDVVIAVSARPFELEAGRPGAVAVFHDITERTRAQAELADAARSLEAELAQRQVAEGQLRAARDELAHERTHLREVLEAIEVSVITCDRDGVITQANRVARASGPVADDPGTISEHAAELRMAHPDGTPVAPEELPLARALRGEPIDDFECVFERGDGTRQIALIHARPLRDRDGSVSGAVSSAYMITALREHEAELRAFSAIVAHDLKSPLTAVQGYAELARESAEDGEDPVEIVRLLDRVMATSARMRGLIDDLLAYADARDGQLVSGRVPLAGILDDVVAEHLAASGPDAAPQIFVGPLPAVCADARLTRQVIDNIVGNALKYTAPGQAARIDVTASTDGAGMVRMEVADRGIGIPAGKHEEVFEGFARAHAGYAGTGLGLAICRRVIRRHGGRIGAEDNPGGGTRVWFTLPAAEPVAQVQAADPPARRALAIA